MWSFVPLLYFGCGVIAALLRAQRRKQPLGVTEALCLIALWPMVVSEPNTEVDAEARLARFEARLNELALRVASAKQVLAEAAREGHEEARLAKQRHELERMMATREQQLLRMHAMLASVRLQCALGGAGECLSEEHRLLLDDAEQELARARGS